MLKYQLFKMNLRLVVIDGNSLFHRAYHALPTTLTNSSGTPINAVYGFCTMLLKTIFELKPTHIAIGFDTQAPTFRHVEFEHYKAQRKAPPEDLYPQLPILKGLLDNLQIKYFEKPGFEADDVIASIAIQSKIDDVVIVSGDRDVLQLISPQIKIQMPGWNLGELTLYDEKQLKAKYGLKPVQMIDYKALMGDQSDNIKGVAGIGPKTAGELLVKYRDLEGVYEHLEDLSAVIKAKLEAGKEDAFKARGLVKLDADIDLGFKISDLRFDPDWEKIKEVLKKLGFRSIVTKIENGSFENKISPKIAETKEKIEKAKRDNDQLELI